MCHLHDGLKRYYFQAGHIDAGAIETEEVWKQPLHAVPIVVISYLNQSVLLPVLWYGMEKLIKHQSLRFVSKSAVWLNKRLSAKAVAHSYSPFDDDTASVLGI
mgnify:CR=1 FL=1